MARATDQAVRERAHEIWEREGRPHGRDEAHWRQAEDELTAAQPKKPAAGARPKAAPASGEAPAADDAPKRKRAGPRSAARP